jgi:hypothetical protein
MSLSYTSLVFTGKELPPVTRSQVASALDFVFRQAEAPERAFKTCAILLQLHARFLGNYMRDFAATVAVISRTCTPFPSLCLYSLSVLSPLDHYG